MSTDYHERSKDIHEKRKKVCWYSWEKCADIHEISVLVFMRLVYGYSWEKCTGIYALKTCQ